MGGKYRITTFVRGIAAWAALLPSFATAIAAEYVVTNDHPDGSGSLREAVEMANAAEGADTITFDTGFFATPRTIEVDRLRIQDPLRIQGPGKDLLRLQSVPSVPTNTGKIYISAPAGTNDMTTVLESLSLAAENGEPTDRLFYAIHHNLTLRNVDLSGSGATYRNAGAAVAIVNAELVMEDVRVEDFHSELPGGAVVGWVNDTRHPSVQSLARIQRTAFRNNSTDSTGGALNIYSYRDPDNFSVLISDSEFSDNFAGYRGGAIQITGAFRTTISNSTFSGNTAESHYGGAIEVLNSEVSASSLMINTSTITNNIAGALGGAISSLGQHAPSIRVANSAIAGNFVVDSDPAVSQDIYADNLLVSYSLIGDSAGSNPALVILEHEAAIGSTLRDTDPRLGPLGDNGGATWTHALRSDSPLLDAGNLNAPTRDLSIAPLTTDQRGAGFSRVSGPGVDIGAFELQAADGNGTGGGSAGSSGGGGGIGAWTLGWLAALFCLVALRRATAMGRSSAARSN